MRLAMTTAVATLLAVLGLGLTATPAPAQDECTLTIEANDQLQFSKDTLEVPEGCDTVTVNLENVGSLPREAGGHNWTLAQASDADAVVQQGIAAGLQEGYHPGDDKVVATTDLIGPGGSDSTEFSADAVASGEYTFVCTFPGHYAAGMKGTLVVN